MDTGSTVRRVTQGRVERDKATSEQLAIADRLVMQVPPDDMFALVDSAILGRIADVIGCPLRIVSDRQWELADDLEIDVTDCSSSWSAFLRIRKRFNP